MAIWMINRSESNMVDNLRTVVDAKVALSRRDESASMNTMLRILTDSVCRFEQRVSELVEIFADRFALIEYAGTLEFTDKPRLTEFIEKFRGLGTAPQLVSDSESGDHVTIG